MGKIIFSTEPQARKVLKKIRKKIKKKVATPATSKYKQGDVTGTSPKGISKTKKEGNAALLALRKKQAARKAKMKKG